MVFKFCDDYSLDQGVVVVIESGPSLRLITYVQVRSVWRAWVGGGGTRGCLLVITEIRC